MLLSIAQVSIVKGDVEENFKSHLQAIECSATAGADLVVFPELSLTGYELELLDSLADISNSDVVSRLSRASVSKGIVIVAGLPYRKGDQKKPFIGAVICFPNGQVEFYAKQYLHDGEAEFCSAGERDYLFEVKGVKVGLAVCADFNEPSHSERLKAKGADLYLASALISDSGYEADAKILSDIANTHGFPVVLSNHISTTGGWQTAGKSAVWNKAGQLECSAHGKEEGITLYRFLKENGE